MNNENSIAEIRSLKGYIFQVLANVSTPHANFWNNTFNEAIEFFTSEEEALKRVNLFWHIHLAKADVDTFEARNFLSDDINIVTWKKRFVSKVVPSIVANVSV